GRSVDEAAAIATVEMVKLMGELYGFSPRQALSFASLVVDLRITQMVNGVRGVHALCVTTLSNSARSRRHESGFHRSSIHAAPPSSDMNERRFIQSPRRRGRAA